MTSLAMRVPSGSNSLGPFGRFERRHASARCQLNSEAFASYRRSQAIASLSNGARKQLLAFADRQGRKVAQVESSPVKDAIRHDGPSQLERQRRGDAGAPQLGCVTVEWRYGGLRTHNLRATKEPRSLRTRPSRSGAGRRVLNACAM